MTKLHAVFLATGLLLATGSALSQTATQLGETDQSIYFTNQVDSHDDGMVSKADLMKRVEKMFDKTDTMKTGRLDRAQFESLVKDLMNYSGA